METRLTKSIFLTLGVIVLSLQDVSAFPSKGKPEGGLITQCQYPGTKGLYISTKKYDYENATTTCEKLGGSLVDLTNQNILLASDMLLTCVGPNSKAWVGSWDYKDDFEPEDGVNDCLSLVVSNIGPSGTVSKMCKGNRYVLCQNHDSPVEHNPLYSQPAWSSASASSVPTLDPAIIEIEDEDDDDFGEYPVYYPKQAADVYPPPRPAAYYPGFDDDTYSPAVKPVYYPRPGGDDYDDTPKKKYKPAFYPKPAAAAGHHNSHWKQNKYPKVIEPADEDCETWTLDGVVTTITKKPQSATSAAAAAPTAAPTATGGASPTAKEEPSEPPVNTDAASDDASNPEDQPTQDDTAPEDQLNQDDTIPEDQFNQDDTVPEDQLDQENPESEDPQNPPEQAEQQQPVFEEDEPDNGPIPGGATNEDILDGTPAQLEQDILANREAGGEAAP